MTNGELIDMNKKNIPYIWLDDKAGEPIMMNERCTIIFSEALSTLRFSLYKVIGDSAELLLRIIGKEMGRKYAQLVIKQFPELKTVSRRTLIHELCSIILRNTGFGKIEILDINLEKPEMKAIIMDAPSEMTVKSKPTINNLEAGMLSGILEEIFKKEMAVAGYSYNQEKNNYEVTIRQVEL